MVAYSNGKKGSFTFSMKCRNINRCPWLHRLRRRTLLKLMVCYWRHVILNLLSKRSLNQGQQKVLHLAERHLKSTWLPMVGDTPTRLDRKQETGQAAMARTLLGWLMTQSPGFCSCYFPFGFFWVLTVQSSIALALLVVWSFSFLKAATWPRVQGSVPRTTFFLCNACKLRKRIKKWGNEHHMVDLPAILCWKRGREWLVFKKL